MASDTKVAMVTGSRQGIGRYVAEQLVAAGCSVVGCSLQPAEWTLANYTHLQADVSVEQDVKRLFQYVRSTFGRLDFTINSAGIASMNHSMLMPASAAGRIMDTNFLGTFVVCRESAKLMQRRKAGRIVNLSTIAVPMRLEGEAVYAASKSAVETLTRILAHELGALGITVNAVGPTPVATNLTRGVPAEALERIAQRLAIKRPGTFEDVWNVVEFFLRPQSSYVTGQVIYLGGA